jgi:hypothetical protein
MLMSDFFGKLKSGAGKVAFDTEKLARVNRVKGEIGKLNGQVEALYLKLGEITYNQFANPGSTAPDISEICQNITGLIQQIGVKNEDIQRINAETYASQGAPAPAQAVPVPPAAAPVQPPAPVQAAPAAQTKFCPNCGKEMAQGVKFCPDCGTKMP